MTRSWIAIAIVLVFAVHPLDRIHAADAAMIPAQKLFLTHQPGDPYLDQARDVQEGCSLPCTTPGEVASYLKKIDTVGVKLGLSGSELARAKENYAPKGIPRKKTSLPAPKPTGKQRSLAPSLNNRISKKANDMAKALGGLHSLSADAGPVDYAQIAAGTHSTARISVKSATKTARTPVPPDVPLDPAQVDKKLEEAFRTEIEKHPFGKRLLYSVPSPPRLILEKIPNVMTAAVYRQENRGKTETEKIVLNTNKIVKMLWTIAPESSKEPGLAEPDKLRRYLAAHPELLSKIAWGYDKYYAHEITHARQERFGGTGWFNHWKKIWILGINKGKGRDPYPIEWEFEAFGNQYQYLLEKAKTDPGVLHNGTYDEFEDYVEDLDQYHRWLKGFLYLNETISINDLWFHGKEKTYSQNFLASEKRQWPRLSIEGLLLLAQALNKSEHPTQALRKLKIAHARIAENKSIGYFRPELIKVFKESLNGIETWLINADGKHTGWTLQDIYIEIIKPLSMDLKVPLPPRTAVVVNKK